MEALAKLARVPRPVHFAAVLAVAVAALGLPGGAEAGVSQRLGVGYGSAVDFDGGREKLRLDLYRPPARKKPRPAIIWVHGGGFTFGDRRYMTPYARAFAERGYVSASITYRLGDNGELRRVGYLAAIRAAQHDAQAAVRWFRRHARRLGVDPKRIYIGGHSAGAVTALEVGVGSDDPGGSGNPGYFSRVDGAIGIAGGVVNTGRVGRGDAELLLFHGDSDDVVPYGGSTRTCAVARTRRLSCTLVRFAGGEHLIAYSELDAIVQRSARWLRERW
jgi:dipeptidyl aminopeptidase/acylaminoacyl peptidase